MEPKNVNRRFHGHRLAFDKYLIVNLQLIDTRVIIETGLLPHVARRMADGD